MDEHDDDSLDDIPRQLLSRAHRIAVLGASTRRDRPAFEVPAYLARHGYEIVPVNPRYAGEELHGRTVLASLSEISEGVDIVDVFRRAEDVTGHVQEILAMRPLPGAVWLQLGIRNDDAARTLREHGIVVVQDRCTKIEHRRGTAETTGATRA